MLNMDIYKVTFEIYINDKLTSRQIIQAPRMIIESQFLSLVKQASQDYRHIRIKMSRDEVI